MRNILLIEPDYRSKFPPLGLMKISTFHKEQGDCVTFARGKVPQLSSRHWHRVYISSLFTYELPRTVDTIRYYLPTVSSPDDIVVGGIGATLLPDYIKENVRCRIVSGPLDEPNKLAPMTPPIADYIPDYEMLELVDWPYKPEDSYFCRTTKGCIRRCRFCAVPKLEPTFGYSDSISHQIKAVNERFGEKQHLVLLDNNVLAVDNFSDIINQIRDSGFHAGATRNGKKRTVDFNQGIDARLINAENAKLLSTICLSPIRLAFDDEAMETAYIKAIRLLAEQGFYEFTNYVMYNFEDTPASLYHRLSINAELSKSLGIKITSFPMRFIPINDVHRGYIAPEWRWRYLRGIQCVLNATHGLVSPNSQFFHAAFGSNYDEFIEILSMPDRYIVQRSQYQNAEAAEWRAMFRALSDSDREELLTILAQLNKSRSRARDIAKHVKFRDILEHYYPDTADSEDPQQLLLADIC